MSDISGGGWGRDHDWQMGETVYRKTYFKCRACGEHFWHDYPNIPEIGKAMYACGISEHCPSAKVAT